MPDIKHRYSIRKVSPKGKGWDVERWFLEYMAEHLVRSRDAITRAGERNRYGRHSSSYSTLIAKWCLIKTPRLYHNDYTLRPGGWRRLFDLRDNDPNVQASEVD